MRNCVGCWAAFLGVLLLDLLASAAPVAPAVRLLWPAGRVQAVGATPLVLRLGVRLPQSGIPDRVTALVDGREVPVRRIEEETAGEKELLGLPPLPDEQVVRVAVTIPAADSTLVMQVEQGGVAGNPAQVQLLWKGPTGGIAVVPKLYVLAIGVSAYQQKRLALVFPHKDASDLVSVLAPQAPKFYQQVEVRALLDDQATREAVLDGLQWLADRTTDKDVAMLFIAGHGVAAPDTGEFYFVPYDGDLQRPYEQTLISGEQVRKALAAVPGKALFFLDACHAGAVIPDRLTRGPGDVNRFVQELQSAARRVMVFSATTDREVAQEWREWGNGAFTKALVEGLSGLADSRGSGRVTVNMLALYVSERVRELTGGKQKPVAAPLAAGEDFPLALSGVPARPAASARSVRPAWRIALGLAVIGAGLLPLGFGAAAVSIDGKVIDTSSANAGRLYDTRSIGAGLLGAGTGMLAGGILCIAWPARRSQ